MGKKYLDLETSKKSQKNLIYFKEKKNVNIRLIFNTEKDFENQNVIFVEVLNNFGRFEVDMVYLHCKYLNARFECNDIVISVYSHYPFDQNAKTFDTKGKTFSIR